MVLASELKDILVYLLLKTHENSLYQIYINKIIIFEIRIKNIIYYYFETIANRMKKLLLI